jgi:putative oxidoreductase
MTQLSSDTQASLQTSQAEIGQSQIAQAIWLLARVGVGSLMIHNGLDKLADVPGFANGVVKFIGLPFPEFFTYCAAYTEIIASVLLIVGVLTRLSALALLSTMFVAIYFHLKKTGLSVPDFEMACLYALFSLLFVVNVGGKFSIDALLTQSRIGTKKPLDS